MVSKKKRLVLIDGNAIIHRSYHALPPMATKSGESVHAVYGFAMTLFSVIDKFKPDYIAASFDLSGGTFRDELYADYKATRTKAPDDLYAQIPKVKELVQAMNIPIYELPGFEADDCVGALSKQGEVAGTDVVIVTGDTDTLQLVTEQVKVYTLRKGLKDMVLYGIPEVIAKYGFPPERLVDYKGLRGDTSDNIPGVKGIGEKGATDLIQEFGSLEDIYAALEKVKPKVREKLEADREIAFLSKTLGTIDTSAPVTLVLDECATHDFNRETIESFLRALDFYSLIKRIPGNGDVKNGVEKSLERPKKQVKKTKRIENEADAKECFECFGSESVTVVLNEKEASLFGNAGIESVGLAGLSEAVEIAWNEATEKSLAVFLSDANRKKITVDSKAIMHALLPMDIMLTGVVEDVLLSVYILHAGKRSDIETLVVEENGADWNGLSFPEKAKTVRVLALSLREKLEVLAEEQGGEHTVVTLLQDIELPLVPVLFAMEEAGVLLDPAVFQKLAEEIDASVKSLEKEIYTFAGKEFNLNSPKQLADVLFVDLAIPTDSIKKNKTGYSTASLELEKLRVDYPIVKLIEEYRETFKLKTTYVDVLPGLVKSDGRLHTTYRQDVAATGRLSSVDPNLQNIPIRTALGARIRDGFIAPAGKKLVGADYSQIELRIAAHLSGDANMTRAFVDGEDIHRATAALVHGLRAEEVSDSLRREAKALNFGIIYGMGAYGLAQATDMDQKKAAQFIKDYLAKFSGVAKYMDDMRKFAHEKGYVETALGRRRFLPEIQSTNQALVRGAERMAINMPIQGLAADIMKLAMLAAHELVQEKYTNSARLLLQIHDELIAEVDESVATAFAADLKQVMEGVYQLSVPLAVSVEIGDNWGEI
ncbi:MAG: DNA polymerase I [Candidatus Moraniibacteriota bacterium]